MKKKLIALRLLVLREKHGYSQEQVAAVLGIQQPAYCELEHGRTTLSANAADILAHFYHLTLDEFFQGIQSDTDQPARDPVGQNDADLHRQTGSGSEEFKRYCETLDEHTVMLKNISGQLNRLFKLMSKSSK